MQQAHQMGLHAAASTLPPRLAHEAADVMQALVSFMGRLPSDRVNFFFVDEVEVGSHDKMGGW